MDVITISVRFGEVELDHAWFASPLTAAEIRREMLKENKSWKGVLQKKGSSKRLHGAQALELGCFYTFTLQEQAGEQSF